VQYTKVMLHKVLQEGCVWHVILDAELYTTCHGDKRVLVDSGGLRGVLTGLQPGASNT